MTAPKPIVIAGAGVAGMTAAVALSGHGLPVVVLEKEVAPGGKMRQIHLDGRGIDSGPTVFTMRHILDDLLRPLGRSLDDLVTLKPLEMLARHQWDDGSQLDLFLDVDRSAEAIEQFAGAREARGYRHFVERSRRTYETLDHPFIRAEKPTFGSLVANAGISGLGGLMATQPMSTLWRSLASDFGDPRLRQLFGRYATYCGSSPFQAPAVLMLVAHVEQAGVWAIEGGMYALAEALITLARDQGADIRCGAMVRRIHTERGRATAVELDDGARIDASAVLFNGDVSALGTGLLGNDVRRAADPTPPGARSLSALTWSMLAEVKGFDLHMHTVFFGSQYRQEFDDIFRRHNLPRDPTIYICAQDRDDRCIGPEGPERLLCLINAPAKGDQRDFSEEEIDQWRAAVHSRLERAGLTLSVPAQAEVATDPAAFNRLFPATGGALYGRASHGWQASFQRPTVGSRIAGLYLAGGSVHPGPGVPMAAQSGRTAAARIIRDWDSIRR